MNAYRDFPLKTKRLVVGQATICRGCCCGNKERGLPDVAVEWLKNEWRKRGLLKRVQLTISGCVGPCDVPNVVVVTSSSGTEWLGNIDKFEPYRSLPEWPCGAGMPAKCWHYRLSFRDLESPPSFGKLPRSASGGRRSRRNSNQDRNQGCRYAVPSPDNLTKRFAKAVRSCCLRLIILWEPNVGRDSDAIFHLYI